MVATIATISKPIAFKKVDDLIFSNSHPLCYDNLLLIQSVIPLNGKTALIFIERYSN
jgi:hypothetical protein